MNRRNSKHELENYFSFIEAQFARKSEAKKTK